MKLQTLIPVIAMIAVPAMPVVCRAQDAPAPVATAANGAYKSPYLADPFGSKTWDDSKNTKKTFTVPDDEGALVMGKAQSIIARWKEKRKDQVMMKIETANDNLIETVNPYDMGTFGLNVSSVKSTEGREITVDARSWEGNPFAVSGQHKEAEKRAVLLAFLLQEYVKELASTPSAASTRSESVKDGKTSSLPAKIDSMLTGIRALLEAGQTDAAIAQLDVLKEMLQKQK